MNKRKLNEGNAERKYESFNVHWKVKEMTGNVESERLNRVVDKNGNQYVYVEINDTREKYVEYLFHDGQPHSLKMVCETDKISSQHSSESNWRIENTNT